MCQEFAGTFSTRAFALYNAPSGFGFVFTAQSLSGDLDAIYAQLVDNLVIFDPAERAASGATWDFSDFASAGREPFVDEVFYPIPSAWSAEDDGLWRRYSGAEGFVAFARIDAADVVTALDTAIEDAARGDTVTVLSERTLIADHHTWSARTYDVTRGETVIRGRLYATLANGFAYVIWTEIPDDDAAAETYETVVEPMIDGFVIGPLPEDE